MATKAFIYLRVSTDKQEKDGTGLDVQLETCQRYAEAHDIDVVDIFTDAATGMDYLNRPQLTSMRERLRVQEVSMILVYKLDRLSRDSNQRGLLEYEAKQSGVVYISTTQDYDPNTLSGRIARGVDGIMSEIERHNIVERTQGGIERRVVVEGKMLANGRAPYGYRWVEVNGKKSHYEIVPEEAAVVRRAYAEILAGESARQVALKFQAEGIPTARGGMWEGGNLCSMLGNPIYKGCPMAWRYSGEHEKRKAKKHGEKYEPRRQPKPMPGAAPAIVSEEMWETVIAELPKRKKTATRNAKNPELSLLRGGVAVCGYCGNYLQHRGGGGTQRKREKNGHISEWTRKRSYRESDASRQRHGCPHYSIDGEKLDKAVWAHVVEHLRHPEPLLLWLENGQETDPYAVELNTLDQYIKTLDKKRAGKQMTLEDVSDSGDEELIGQLRCDIKRITEDRMKSVERREKVMAERVAWQASQEQVREVRRFIEKWQSRLTETATPAWKRKVLEKFRITVRVFATSHTPRATIEWNIPLSGDPEVYTLDLTEDRPQVDISPLHRKIWAALTPAQVLGTGSSVNTAAYSSIYNRYGQFRRISFPLSV